MYSLFENFLRKEEADRHAVVTNIEDPNFDLEKALLKA